MKLLITGFKPFHNDKINSSWEAIKMISQETFSTHLIITEILPVSFKDIGEKIKALLEKHQPDLFLMLGQSGNSEDIRIERVAINLKDATIPDNDNIQPNEETIIPQGDIAYFSNLPLKRIKQKLQSKGIPVRISNSAGTFVCNCAFYHALYQQSLCYPNMKVGFIHIPLIEEQKALHPNQNSIKKTQLEHYMLQIIQFLLEIF